VRSRELLVVVLLATVGLYGVTAADGSDAGTSNAVPAERLVAPDGADGYVWPYTSRSRSVAGRTLALNVVVYGDADRVYRALADRSDANWSATGATEPVRVSPWRPAHGSVRYTYVAPARNGTGRWVAADYQLDVGAYFGRRTHVRAYAGPAGNWTVLQAHTEYWDWFRLRHTVTGVDAGARFVEADLRGEPFVAEITRAYHGHDGGGSDGRWTVVTLASASLVAGVAGVAVPLLPRGPSRRDLALPAALVGLVLGVRVWGLAAEAISPGITPKLFVAAGYPVLAVGPLALVAVLACGRPARLGALLAAAGLGCGVALDLALVGVRHVPPHLAFHRVALVAALGTVAFGTGRDDRRAVGAGVAAWTVALLAPLLGVA
jgi:hypothetical protein